MTRLAFAVLALFLTASPVLAAADYNPLPNPAQEARARALQKQLRCVVCQGESLDESSAPLAADLRALIREKIAAGQTDQQIKDFLVQRYGPFILMKPPLREDTYLLWFGPGLLLLIGAGVVGLTIYRSRRRAGDKPLTEDFGSDAEQGA